MKTALEILNKNINKAASTKLGITYNQKIKRVALESMQEYADQQLLINGVSNCAIEQAKIEATKRIKMVVEVALFEYSKALENGRCNECKDPLVKGEKDTCEDCLCPE